MDSSEEKLEHINQLLNLNFYLSKATRKQIDKIYKESEENEMNNKVKMFLGLIEEGKSVDDAVNETGVNEMKTHDLLDSIAMIWKGISTIKKLDNAMVELTKVSDATVEELEK